MRFALLAVALGLTVAATPLTACNTSRDSGQVAAVDPSLLAFLSRARAAHHRADLFEAENRLGACVDELSSVIAGPLPPGEVALPEVREVLADTLARRADLASRLGRDDAAVADVRRGLQLAHETSYFQGHLHEVLGLVEERRARRLDAELDRLLGGIDARLGPMELAAIERLVAAREAALRGAQAETPEASDSSRQSLTEADRALRDGRLAHASPQERATVESQRAEAHAARERALAAFAEAIAVQSQVIERSLGAAPPSPRPSAPSNP